MRLRFSSILIVAFVALLACLSIQAPAEAWCRNQQQRVVRVVRDPVVQVRVGVDRRDAFVDRVARVQVERGLSDRELVSRRTTDVLIDQNDALIRENDQLQQRLRALQRSRR